MKDNVKKLVARTVFKGIDGGKVVWGGRDLEDYQADRKAAGQYAAAEIRASSPFSRTIYVPGAGTFRITVQEVRPR